MKIFLRILIVLAALLLVAFCTDQSIKENDVLEAPSSPGLALPMNTTAPTHGENPSRPTEGLSVLVGKAASELIKVAGEPNRIEPSAYGYEWWVYNTAYSTYMMAGIKNGEVNQIFAGGESLDVTPFKIGGSIEDIYRSTILIPEITVPIGSNIYVFSLNEEDMHNRMLVAYEGLYAQLYVDEYDQTLEAVRFIAPEPLVLHKPYDMTYKGQLITADIPSSELQPAIDLANERQLFDLTNLFRLKHGLTVLKSDNAADVAARLHSSDMAKQNFFSHESPEFGDLEERLSVAGIIYDYAGENIASNYVDAAEAVHGWSNSKDHRDVMMKEDFTHIGVGAFGKFYTQNFLKREPIVNESK